MISKALPQTPPLLPLGPAWQLTVTASTSAEEPFSHTHVTHPFSISPRPEFHQEGPPLLKGEVSSRAVYSSGPFLAKNRGADSLKNAYDNCLPLKSHAFSTNTTQPGPILPRALLAFCPVLHSSPAVQLLGSSSSTRIAAFNSGYSAPRLGNVGSTQVLLYAPHLLFPRVLSAPYPPAILPRRHVLVQSTMTGKAPVRRSGLFQFNSIQSTTLPLRARLHRAYLAHPASRTRIWAAQLAPARPRSWPNYFCCPCVEWFFFFILFHALPG